MRAIVTGRVAGKTYKAMEWLSRQPNGVLVVFNEIERDRLIKLYKISDKPNSIIKPNQIVSWGSANRGSLRGRRIRIGIDNLDIILHDIFREPVDLITMTGQAET